MDNYSKTYAELFHHVHHKRHWPGRSGPTILLHEVRRSSGCPPSVCILDNMDGVKTIDTIDVVIANSIITRLRVPTHRHHHFLFSKYVYRYISNVIH